MKAFLYIAIVAAAVLAVCFIIAGFKSFRQAGVTAGFWLYFIVSTAILIAFTYWVNDGFDARYVAGSVFAGFLIGIYKQIRGEFGIREILNINKGTYIDDDKKVLKHTAKWSCIVMLASIGIYLLGTLLA